MAEADEELLERFASHSVDRDNAAHFRGRLNRQLLINRCGDCGRWHHPPKPVCPGCWSTAIEPSEVDGTGEVHLLIRLHQGPPAPGVDYSTPYPVVTVELDEQQGLRFTATVEEGDIAIGQRVELDWIERAGVPVPIFRLAREVSL